MNNYTNWVLNAGPRIAKAVDGAEKITVECYEMGRGFANLNVSFWKMDYFYEFEGVFGRKFEFSVFDRNATLVKVTKGSLETESDWENALKILEDAHD